MRIILALLIAVSVQAQPERIRNIDINIISKNWSAASFNRVFKQSWNVDIPVVVNQPRRRHRVTIVIDDRRENWESVTRSRFAGVEHRDDFFIAGRIGALESALYSLGCGPFGSRDDCTDGILATDSNAGVNKATAWEWCKRAYRSRRERLACRNDYYRGGRRYAGPRGWSWYEGCSYGDIVNAKPGAFCSLYSGKAE